MRKYTLNVNNFSFAYLSIGVCLTDLEQAFSVVFFIDDGDKLCSFMDV